MKTRMLLRSAALAASCLLLATTIDGQSKPLTVEELYTAEGWTRFNGSQWASMSWAPDEGPW